MNNPAFEYLRQFKKISDDTEALVTKFIKKKYPELGMKELVQIFENGIAGEYGKIYSADPETILDWIRKHINNKGNKEAIMKRLYLPQRFQFMITDIPKSTKTGTKKSTKPILLF